MSETPRTDAVLDDYIEGYPVAHVLFAISRQLERELAAMRERAERAEARVADLEAERDRAVADAVFEVVEVREGRNTSTSAKQEEAGCE